MKNKLPLILIAAAFLASSCSHKNGQENVNITLSPESGTAYKAGQPVVLKAHYPAGTKPDSVVYLLDSVKIAASKDSTGLTLKTDTMKMGLRLLTVKVYTGGKSNEASTNIVLMAAKAPEAYTYRVVKVYPHDTSAYTEGLLYQDGYLYESTGNEGHSDLRKVDLETGKVVQRARLDAKYFGEGSAIVGNKIVMLTYRERVGFVFDKNTFK